MEATIDMKLRKASVLALVLLFIFAPLANVQATEKILVSLPLTGPAANYGQELSSAIRFFAKRFKFDADFILVDDRCDGKEAVSALQEAIARQHVAVVVGAPCSGVVLSIAPICEQKNVPLISFGAMASRISELGGEVYRVGIRDNKVAEVLAPVVNGQSVTAIVEQTEFATSVAERLKKLQPSSFTTPDLEFSSRDADFAALALQASKNKPDGIFISSQSATTLAGLVKALTVLNSEIPVFTSVFAESPVFYQLAPTRSMTIQYTQSPTRNSCGDKAVTRQIFSDFESEFAKLTSNDFTLIAAEIGMRLLKARLANPGTRPERIDGICGPVSFDRVGDMHGLDLRLVEVSPMKGRPQ